MNDSLPPLKTLAGEIRYENLSQADKQLVATAVRSGYSRRQVLKLMMATGVSFAAAQNLLSSGGQALAQTPRKGGSVRMAAAVHGPDDQLDPVLFTSTIDYTRGRAIYNSLVQHANDLTPQPELAEEFSPNKDASEWTFKIRKGVVFHDGSPLTADDIVYSMKRHQGEDSKSTIKSVLASIKEWKKTGSHEVKAIIDGSNADLPVLLGLFQTKIVKNGSTDRSNGIGIGTGPFTLDAFEPGVKSVHVRNPNYWRDGANLEGCEITGITDPVARVNALAAGDIQLASRIEPKAIAQIESAPGVGITSLPSALYMGICALKSTLPGANDDFVKGLQYIQDRQRIVDKILKGHGTVGNDQPIMQAHGKDFCHELALREYDPDKAKAHFKKAGINSAELHVAPVTSGIEDACLLMQANLAKIGFDLKIKKVPADGYWGAVWLKEPLNVVTWNMRPTAYSQLAIQFAPQAAWNDTHWHDDRMGTLLKSVLSELDETKRHEMYCEMQTLVHEKSGIVIPAHINVIDGVSDKVKGIPTVPLGQLGGCEWPEFCWLDA